MDERFRTDARVAALVVAALEGKLTEQQGEQLAAIDDALGKLVWLAAGPCGGRRSSRGSAESSSEP